MTPYFNALLAFMLVFSIGGVTFDGFASVERSVVLVAVSYAAAMGVYVLTKRFQK
ncbi:hypothetical protein ACEE23_04645 [Corynebacterium sp. 32222D000AT]|nr:hypothetical protein [Mycobacteriaceae bacterium]MDY5829101.1 hypothetical protein [Corynebacterium sp.]